MIQGNILRPCSFIFITITVIIAGCVDNKINTDKEINPSEEIKTFSLDEIYEWNSSLFAVVNEYSKNIKDYESGKIEDSAFIDLSLKRDDEIMKLVGEINRTERPTNVSLELAVVYLALATLKTGKYTLSIAEYVSTDNSSMYKLAEDSKKEAEENYNNFAQYFSKAGFNISSNTLNLPIITEKYISIETDIVEADRVGFYKPRKGNIFLIVTLTIYNNGYKKFNTNPFLFKLEVDDVLYSFDSSTYSLNSETYHRVGSKQSEKSGHGSLQNVDLLNGGEVSGDLVFEIPNGYQDYKIIYDGYRTYNIK